MVFTRSTLRKSYFLMYNSEMDRIRTEYASSEDEAQIRTKRKYVRKVNICPSISVTSPVVDSCSVPCLVPCPVPCPVVYSVDIDFDGAHDAWMANKKRKANGDYAYLCGAPLKTGNPCKRYCCDKIGLYSGCRTHYSWEESAHKGVV